ncbi:cytochrome P450 [Aspergillus keveii]|uniref:Cytochrome P450 n=1 Tax=Aspergillus keveii TaxID=714993 RepID=A0ABR4G894_9EURO
MGYESFFKDARLSHHVSCIKALVGAEDRFLDREKMVLAAIATLFIGAFGNVLYQLYLHPLSDVPGPTWYKLSPVPLRWSEIQVRRAPMLLGLHRKYGSTVRVGPNEISIADPAVYREIYNGKTHLKEARFYEPFQFLGNGNLFGSVDHSIHGSRRRMISTPFSHQQIIQNEGLINERVTAFINRTLDVASSSGGRVDVFDLCGLLSLEVICRLAFNYDFSTDMELSRKLLTALEGSVLALILNPIFPFLRNASYRTKLPGALGHAYGSFETWVSTTRALLKDLDSQDLNEHACKKYIAAPLLRETSRHLNRKYTFDEVTEESMGLESAGTGVTQHMLVYFLYTLSKPENRHMQIRLRDELLSSSATSYGELSSLPYFTACFKEIYRLYPVIMSTLPRVLQTPLFLPTTGHTLPPGTVVGMQNYVHHRDSSLYPHPDSFVPDRWLEGSTLATNLKQMDSALTPYSVGPRSCLGQTIAKVELHLAVAPIVRTLDLRLDTSMTEDDMAMLDFWAVFPKGAKLVLNVQRLDKQGRTNRTEGSPA